MLERADGPSSLAVLLSLMAKLLEDRIDAVAANEVHWGKHWHWLLPCCTF
jgi:hypothetical protein